MLKQQYGTIVSSIVSDHKWIKEHGSDLNFLLYQLFNNVFEGQKPKYVGF